LSLTRIPVSFSSALFSPTVFSRSPHREYLSSPASAADVPLPVRPRRFARYPLSTWNVSVFFFCLHVCTPRLFRLQIVPPRFQSFHGSHLDRLIIRASGKIIAVASAREINLLADSSFRDTQCVYAFASVIRHFNPDPLYSALSPLICEVRLSHVSEARPLFPSTAFAVQAVSW